MTSNPTSPLSRSVLNVFLVLIESVLALVLRFDPKLRRVVYPLVKAETLVAIRTYLPHTQVYATFSYKGVLIDDNLPIGREPDVVINAYTHELFAALLGQNPDSIDKIQMRGRASDILLLKDFLAQLGVGAVLTNLLGKFQKEKKTPSEKAQYKENKIQTLSDELQIQSKKAQQLHSDNQKLRTQLAESQSKQKTLFIAFVVSSVIAFVAIVLRLLGY